MSAKTFEVVTFDAKAHYAWLVWCPACDTPHTFDNRWSFNGDHDRPTFDGSMLVYETPVHPRCHSFLTDGVWEYCADSTHGHANQKLPAPDWEATRYGKMWPDGVVPSEKP